jgi:hypothetical protein
MHLYIPVLFLAVGFVCPGRLSQRCRIVSTFFAMGGGLEYDGNRLMHLGLLWPCVLSRSSQLVPFCHGHVSATRRAQQLGMQTMCSDHVQSTAAHEGRRKWKRFTRGCDPSCGRLIDGGAGIDGRLSRARTAKCIWAIDKTVDTCCGFVQLDTSMSRAVEFVSGGGPSTSREYHGMWRGRRSVVGAPGAMGQLRQRAISARHAPGCSALPSASASRNLLVSSKVAHPPSVDNGGGAGPFLRAVGGSLGTMFGASKYPSDRSQDCVPAVVYLTLMSCSSASGRPVEFGEQPCACHDSTPDSLRCDIRVCMCLHVPPWCIGALVHWCIGAAARSCSRTVVHCCSAGHVHAAASTSGQSLP